MAFPGTDEVEPTRVFGCRARCGPLIASGHRSRDPLMVVGRDHAVAPVARADAVGEEVRHQLVPLVRTPVQDTYVIMGAHRQPADGGGLLDSRHVVSGRHGHRPPSLHLRCRCCSRSAPVPHQPGRPNCRGPGSHRCAGISPAGNLLGAYPRIVVVLGCPRRSSGVVPIDAAESKHDADRPRDADPMTISSQIDSRSALLGAGVEAEDNGAGVRVVRLRGELDAFSAPSLRDDLRREVVARPAVVALDLSDLEFLGVAGLNVLVEMQQAGRRGRHGDAARRLARAARGAPARTGGVDGHDRSGDEEPR